MGPAAIRKRAPESSAAPSETSLPPPAAHDVPAKEARPRQTARTSSYPTIRKYLRVIAMIAAAFFARKLIYLTWSSEPPSQNVLRVGTNLIGERTGPIDVDVQKRAAILEAFQHSYSSYERDAWGFDDYHPISHKGGNMSPKGGIGYFIVDCLDSLLIMGLKEEFDRAREWVKDLSFDVDDKFHNFEVTIRVLGGLLSAYSLSGKDPLFLEKAIDLADRLLPVFDTPSGIPLSYINLHTGVAIPDFDNRGLSSVAEAATLQLEFKYLSEVSGNPIYWHKAERVMEVLRNQTTLNGLVPIFVDPTSGRLISSDIRLGSRGDSYYEYLSKQYIQTNGTQSVYREMHLAAMAGVKMHLLHASAVHGLYYTGELMPQRQASGGLRTVLKQDHLACFIGASLMLGATEVTHLNEPFPRNLDALTDAEIDDLDIGAALIRGCVDTYFSTKTGLAPEIAMYYSDSALANEAGREWFINSRKQAAPNPPIDARNILRPETVESLFVAYRVTGDPIYREWGWAIFEAFQKHCRLPEGGFASILDVDQIPVVYEDRMETFWLAETLKYLYLLFSEEDLIPLDQYVFNTEAHPLPVFTPSVVSPR